MFAHPPADPTLGAQYTFDAVLKETACNIINPVCTVQQSGSSEMRCFDDTVRGSLLPTAEPSTHDRNTLEVCASACFGQKYALAGIDEGNHCYCGGEADLDSTAARAKKQPLAECQVTPCKADPSQKCGGVNRLLVYQYNCSNSSSSSGSVVTTKQLQCLEGYDGGKLVALASVKAAAFGPVVDGVELLDTPIALLRKGAVDTSGYLRAVAVGSMAEVRIPIVLSSLKRVIMSFLMILSLTN